MKGYGLSTFSGTEPQRWSFEVVGVVKNFQPKMDVILVKSDDESLQVTGFWRGMSGSPMFIDNKLTCAYSYGWNFNKLPIGACTPIQYMIDEGLDAPVRGRPTAAAGGGPSIIQEPAATRAQWRALAPSGRPSEALASLGPPRQPWLMRAPLPPAPTIPSPKRQTDPSALVPAAVPLAISGLTGPAFEMARELMAPYPVEPMQAGGGGHRDEGPTHFSLGSPISVELARGDSNFVSTGTVSYVNGERVLAFGHPFFEQGEFYAPVTAAEVHTVIPSAISAFVMASPLRELGSLVQDRLPAIMADTRLRNPMIPMSIQIDIGEGESIRHERFDVEIINNRFLTSSMAGLMTMNAITRYLPDRDRATVLIESTVAIKGYEPLQFVDYLSTEDGAASVIGGARGLRVLVPLLFNPFSPVEIERISFKVALSFDANFGAIVDLRLPAQELTPGKRNYVDVVMTRYDESQVVERIPFDVPTSLAGSIVKLTVQPGDTADPDSAPAKNLGDLIRTFRGLLPGTVFAVTLLTAEPGVAVDGKLIRDMPPSALDRIYSGASTQSADPYQKQVRSTSFSTRVINGTKSMLVQVADE